MYYWLSTFECGTRLSLEAGPVQIMLERCACGLSVGKVSLVFQVYRNSWLGAELGDGLPFVVVDLIVLEMK